MMMDSRADLDAVMAGLAKVEEYAADAEVVAHVDTPISKWSIGQHLHHVAISTSSMGMVVRGILKGRTEAVMPDPDQAAVARAIFETGQIPRGKGKAPEGAVPEDAPTGEEIQAAVQKARSRWSSLMDKHAELENSIGRLPHPLLGPLTAAEWVRFTAVHEEHHLHIIAEILAAR